MAIEDGVIVLDRVVAAPVDRVWSAFTEPDAMAAWMWAGLGANPRATADVRPGGRYRVAIDEEPGQGGWASGERAIEGVYAVVEPPRRLVFTLHWDAPVGYNQQGRAVPDECVILELTELAVGTRVMYRHLGVPDDGVSAAAHQAGDSAALDRLVAIQATPASS